MYTQDLSIDDLVTMTPIEQVRGIDILVTRTNLTHCC